MVKEMAATFQHGQVSGHAFWKRSDFYTQYSLQDHTGNVHMLQNSKMEKDLGVWMDDSLKFFDHMLLAAKNANQILEMIKRSFNYLDMKSTVKLLYVCMFRPHLEYGNVVWHPRFKKDMNLLENVQHRATRMIPAWF